PAVAAMSPVTRPSGIVAIVRRRSFDIDKLFNAVDAFVLAAVDIQDPGNLGSMIRAAEAGGATGAIACGASANPFSWKSMRGSMGSALRLPLVSAPSVMAVIDHAQRAATRTVAAIARTGREPDEVDWSGRVLLLMGGEGAGLPE